MKEVEIVVGIALLNLKHCQILLQLRDNKFIISDPNMWVLPGGTVENGESIHAAIKREVLEETGYKLKDPKLFRCLTINYSLSKVKSLYFFFEEFDLIQNVKCYEGQKMEFVELSFVKYLNTPTYLSDIIATLIQEKIELKLKFFNFY